MQQMMQFGAADRVQYCVVISWSVYSIEQSQWSFGVEIWAEHTARRVCDILEVERTGQTKITKVDFRGRKNRTKQNNES